MPQGRGGSSGPSVREAYVKLALDERKLLALSLGLAGAAQKPSVGPMYIRGPYCSVPDTSILKPFSTTSHGPTPNTLAHLVLLSLASLQHSDIYTGPSRIAFQLPFTTSIRFHFTTLPNLIAVHSMPIALLFVTALCTSVVLTQADAGDGQPMDLDCTTYVNINTTSACRVQSALALSRLATRIAKLTYIYFLPQVCNNVPNRVCSGGCTGYASK